jgi:hypothetical protein
VAPLPSPAKTLFKGLATVITAAPAILPIIFLLFMVYNLRKFQFKNSKYIVL